MNEHLIRPSTAVAPLNKVALSPTTTFTKSRNVQGMSMDDAKHLLGFHNNKVDVTKRGFRSKALLPTPKVFKAI